MQWKKIFEYQVDDFRFKEFFKYSRFSKSYYMRAFTANSLEVQDAWRYVVRDYTALELSCAKDKLPALSGIAKKFIGLRPKDRYVAGLWQQTFLQDMLWCVFLPEKDAQPRPREWRAPTCRCLWRILFPFFRTVSGVSPKILFPFPETFCSEQLLTSRYSRVVGFRSPESSHVLR